MCSLGYYHASLLSTAVVDGLELQLCHAFLLYTAGVDGLELFSLS
jgi:hypothetical protein